METGERKSHLAFLPARIHGHVACHRSKARTGSCCIMMNPQSPQIVIDSDAQLRISHNELLSPAGVTSQSLGKLPSPTVHSYNRHSPPQPPPHLDFSLIGRGLLFPPGLPDNPPPPGLIMLGLFLVHYDPRKALSDCPTDRDQISNTCLPC